jgi:hypothetical protein
MKLLRTLRFVFQKSVVGLMQVRDTFALSDMTGLDERIVRAVLPSLRDKGDNGVIDDLLTLSSMSEHLDPGLCEDVCHQLISAGQHSAVVSTLLQLANQREVERFRPVVQEREKAAVHTGVESVVSAVCEDDVVTLSGAPAKKKGLLGWFGAVATNSHEKLRPLQPMSEEQSGLCSGMAASCEQSQPVEHVEESHCGSAFVCEENNGENELVEREDSLFGVANAKLPDPVERVSDGDVEFGTHVEDDLAFNKLLQQFVSDAECQ